MFVPAPRPRPPLDDRERQKPNALPSEQAMTVQAGGRECKSKYNTEAKPEKRKKENAVSPRFVPENACSHPKHDPNPRENKKKEGQSRLWK